MAEYVDCETCHGQGFHPCPDCDDGVDCPNPDCDGGGYQTCETCDGDGFHEPGPDSDDPHDLSFDEHDCLECGQCDSCVERSIAYYEECAEEERAGKVERG